MKNQYFGDIGDFGKYGLIRYLQKSLPSIRIGINWYMTENGGRTDGKYIEYLAKPDRFRKCDSELYDFLQDRVSTDKRSVREIETADILGNVIFYSEMLQNIRDKKERIIHRQKWFSDSILKLQHTDLIYVDPDNGIEIKSMSIDGAKGNKYISYNEIVQYYNRGFSLIVYNHRDRSKSHVYMEKFTAILDCIDAKLIHVEFFPYSVRSFLFVLHDKIADDMEKCLYKFVDSAWRECFRPPKSL